MPPPPDAPPRNPRPWRLREPDAKDLAVLAALYEARVLTAPQLQRLYGLESVGSLHPRLLGLLGPEGAPRVLERAKAPDGRYFYGVGPEGYATLGDLPRHKPLARLRLSAQFTDHAQAVGWLMLTWLLGEGTALPPASGRAWWGERRAILPYPLRQPQGAITRGRVEPDGVLVLTLPDGARWCSALEHDQGTEDAADWAGKLSRWAAAIRAGSWQERYGATVPHLLVTVRTPARRMQLAPWLAAGREKHGKPYIWIADLAMVSLTEADPPGVAAERVAARAWQQVGSDPARPLLPDLWAVPGIIAATAPWRPDAPLPGPGESPRPRLSRSLVLPPAEAEIARLRAALIEQEIQQRALAGQAQQLRTERDRFLQELASARVDGDCLTARYQQTLAALTQLQADQPGARLRRFWTPRSPFLLVARWLLAVVAGWLAGVLVTGGWLLGARLWEAAQTWDAPLAALVAEGTPGGPLLIHLLQAPWCGGLLLSGSAIGATALARWARQRVR